jgi:glycosyltransferase involved in cell wall biosynthesis
MENIQRTDTPTPKTYEPTRRRLSMNAVTDIPLLVPELARQMQQLAQAHGFELLGGECEVRLVFTGRVSKDTLDRLLRSCDCGIYASSEVAEDATS